MEVKTTLSKIKKYLFYKYFYFYNKKLINFYNKKLINFYNKNYHIFFGYYDINPFSLDNNKVLVHRVFKYGINKLSNICEIGFYYINNKKFKKIGETDTWCWQQGSRLRWFPSNEDRLVLYNKIINSHYCSVIRDIYSKEDVYITDFPIYDLSHDGKLALSLNFSRLERLRPGYGYNRLLDETKDENEPTHDGLWLCEIDSNKKELLISLESLSKYDKDSSMNGSVHYINHLSFNPSGDKFLFFHLWKNEKKENNRLFVLDINGNVLYMNRFEGNVSHYTWKDDNKIIITIWVNDNIQKYLLIDIKNNIIHNYLPRILNKDGHPNFFNGKLVTDTYPDKFGQQYIYIIDKNNKVETVATFQNSPWFVGKKRCDLHPRWDRKGSFICVDRILNNKRIVSLIKLKDNFYE